MTSVHCNFHSERMLRRSFKPFGLTQSCLKSLVIHTDERTLIVELQVNIIRQLYIIAITLLINLRDNGTGEVGGDILLDGLRDDGSRNGSIVAVHLLPVTLAIELNLRTIVQTALIRVPVLLGIDNLLALEVGLYEGLSSCGQLLYGNRRVISQCNIRHKQAHQSHKEKLHLFHSRYSLIVKL